MEENVVIGVKKGLLNEVLQSLGCKKRCYSLAY